MKFGSSQTNLESKTELKILLILLSPLALSLQGGQKKKKKRYSGRESFLNTYIRAYTKRHKIVLLTLPSVVGFCGICK